MHDLRWAYERGASIRVSFNGQAAVIALNRLNTLETCMLKCHAEKRKRELIHGQDSYPAMTFINSNSLKPFYWHIGTFYSRRSHSFP